MDDDPAAVPAGVLRDLWARKNLAHGGSATGSCGEEWRVRGRMGGCLTGPLSLAHSFSTSQRRDGALRTYPVSLANRRVRIPVPVAQGHSSPRYLAAARLSVRHELLPKKEPSVVSGEGEPWRRAHLSCGV